MQTKSFFKKMTDGYELWVNRWMPDDNEEIKAVIELHHGLAEHSMRYDRLGSILAENGYVFNAYDMRGHGKTAENAEKNGTGMFGKLCDKDGFNRVVEDLNEMIESLKAEFPEKPVILLGHSFGSFVAQGYIEKYSQNITACTLCGTAGPQKALVTGGCICAAIIKFFRGKNAIVPLLSKLSFGSYNKRIPHPSCDNDWLSSNEENVAMYESDKWCGIPLTVSFFYDMTHGLKQIHKAANIKKISNDLPINFIYGKEDPVGGYGETVEKLYNIYKENGVKKLTIKGYDGDRHEIFNENDKETVEKDFLDWISSVLTK